MLDETYVRVCDVRKDVHNVFPNKYYHLCADLQSIYRVDQKSWRVRKKFTVASKIYF